MLEILEKVNKFDGIGYNERFLLKEDLYEKTTTILHNEIHQIWVSELIILLIVLSHKQENKELIALGDSQFLD